MKNTTKFFFSLLLALGMLLIQVGGVLAAPGLQNRTPVSGIVQSITLEANTVTGVTLVSIDLIDDNQAVQTVRLSLETAIAQGLVILNGDGKPGINDVALGKPIEIDSSSILPNRQETQHPVGSALATFFSDIPGIDYETIMSVHEQGVGFGTIAQALWLTTKLEGNAEIFETLIEAQRTGDFSAFILEDGSTPQNWGQLRRGILAKDKENGLGIVISNSHSNGNGNERDHENGNGNGANDNGNNGGNGNNANNGNNGNSGGNGNGGGDGNGNGNGNGGGNGNNGGNNGGGNDKGND